MQCVEVYGPDGTSKRFALGTRASFVVDRFNKKLVDAIKPVVCVEAFKYGEEPVEFGPDAPLMSICDWDLRVVQEGTNNLTCTLIDSMIPNPNPLFLQLLLSQFELVTRSPTASSRTWIRRVSSNLTVSTSL